MAEGDARWVERVAPLVVDAIAAVLGERGQGGQRGLAAPSDGAIAEAIESLLEVMFLVSIAEVPASEVASEARAFSRACGLALEGVAGVRLELEGAVRGWVGAVEREGVEARLRTIAGRVAGGELAEPAFRLAAAISLATAGPSEVPTGPAGHAGQRGDDLELVAAALGVGRERAAAIAGTLRYDPSGRGRIDDDPHRR